MQTIKNQLRDFKLSGIYNALEERISLANQKFSFYLEF